MWVIFSRTFNRGRVLLMGTVRGGHALTVRADSDRGTHWAGATGRLGPPEHWHTQLRLPLALGRRPKVLP